MISIMYKASKKTREGDEHKFMFSVLITLKGFLASLWGRVMEE
jgi:hypothetical protein